jgi:dTDP-4-dehydrorhamnose reductase
VERAIAFTLRPAMRVLITGAAGMLGQDLHAAVGASGHEAVALARGDLDVTGLEAVRAAIRDARPDAVVNCAAYTNVDGAESDLETALSVNGRGAGNVAQAADEASAWTIHISSDYVFDGEKRDPYLESDRTNPLSAYGTSKLAGEHAVVRASPSRHTIVRSSWLFGIGGPCFPATIMHGARERDELTVVDDQVGCPTFTGHLAAALARLVSDPIPGILHLAAGGSCSWFELAREIVAAIGADCTVKPGRTVDLARPATRPAYSVLRSERGAPELPHWREGLGEYLAAAVPAT